MMPSSSSGEEARCSSELEKQLQSEAGSWKLRGLLDHRGFVGLKSSFTLAATEAQRCFLKDSTNKM